MGIQWKAIAACSGWRALFYFVMNMAMNFVGSTFKVIWLHIHSQGNASFTSVNADTLQSRKRKQDLLAASFYFGACLSSERWMYKYGSPPLGPQSCFLRSLNGEKRGRERAERNCFSHCALPALFLVEGESVSSWLKSSVGWHVVICPPGELILTLPWSLES